MNRERFESYLKSFESNCGLIYNVKIIDYLDSGAYGKIFLAKTQNDNILVLKITFYDIKKTKKSNSIKRYYDYTENQIAWKKLVYYDINRPENIENSIHLKINKLFEKYKMDFNCVKLYASSICTDSNLLEYIRTVFGKFNIYVDYTKIVRLSFMEYCDYGCLENFLKDYNVDPLVFEGILLQLIMIRFFLSITYPSFYHNDLHIANLLVKKRNEPIVYNISPTLSFVINNPIVVILLNDFDSSEDNQTINPKFQHFYNTDFRSEYTDIHKFFNHLKVLINYNLIKVHQYIYDFIDYVCPVFLTGHTKYYNSGNKEFLLTSYFQISCNLENLNVVYNDYKFDESLRYTKNLINDPLFKKYKVIKK